MFANYSDIRRSHPALMAVLESPTLDGNYIDFGESLNDVPSKMLADAGKRLYLGHAPTVEVRLTVTTPSSVDYVLEHSAGPASTLRELDGNGSSGTVAGNESDVVWSKPIPPGWIAIDVGGAGNVDVELASGISGGQGPRPVRPGSDGFDFQSGHATQTSWRNIAVVELPRPQRIKEIKPYVLDTSDGGNTTDARLITAIDPRHLASQGDPANDDAPTGSISDGDGWRLVDSALSANSEAVASGGDWPEIGPGYEDLTHLAVLQAQQGSGQETIYGSLSLNEDK